MAAVTNKKPDRAAAMQPGPADIPSSYPDRVVGCFLAAMAGDALGAYVEGWTAHRVLQEFPNGLTEFQKCRMGRGCYTDDTQMLLALAACLVNAKGVCKASDAATEWAKVYDPLRGYGGSAGQILAQLQQKLQDGPLPATLGTELLEKGGSYGNGGAMRVAPLGLAYRNAPLPVLEAALMQSLIPTHHVHPWAVEGALTQALAVAHLCKLQPQPSPTPAPAQHSSSSQPSAPTAPAPAPPADAAAPHQSGAPPAGALELLRVLRSQLQGRSDVMCSRLAVMEQGLHKLYSTPGGPKQQHTSWPAYFSSPAWHEELSTTVAVAPGEQGSGFQIKGTDAVAAAVWACVAHWEGAPQDAVVAACHYGGDTDTIACMAGALVGARYGSSWLPEQWLSQLEADAAGVAFFNTPAVQAALSTQGPAAAAGGDGGCCQQQQEEDPPGAGEASSSSGKLVLTTKNMGREGAVVLARLLARIDYRGA